MGHLRLALMIPIALASLTDAKALAINDLPLMDPVWTTSYFIEAQTNNGGSTQTNSSVNENHDNGPPAPVPGVYSSSRASTGADVTGTFKTTLGPVLTIHSVQNTGAVSQTNTLISGTLVYQFKITPLQADYLPTALVDVKGVSDLFYQQTNNGQALSVSMLTAIRITSPTDAAGRGVNYGFTSAPGDVTVGQLGRVSFDDQFNFAANTLYTVTMDVLLNMEAKGRFCAACSSNQTADVYLDPIFTVLDPGYSIEFSNGIQNSIAEAVPEPSTWAMMLIGLAGIGFTAAYRRKHAGALEA